MQREVGGEARGGAYALAGSAASAVFLVAFRGAGDLPRAGFVVALLAVAMVANLSWSLVKPGGRLRLSGFEHGVALLLGACSVIGNVSIGQATTELGPGLTGILVQTEIFFITFLSWMFLRERITGRFAVGALISLAGIALMRVPAAGGEVSLTGAAWALSAAMAFSITLVLTRAVIDRIDAEGINAFRLTYAVPVTFLLPGGAAVLELPASAWAWAAVAGLSGPFLSRLCLMHAVKTVSAAHAKLINLSTPVFAFVLDFALFAAIPTLLELASGALILLGVALPAHALMRRRSSPVESAGR